MAEAGPPASDNRNAPELSEGPPPFLGSWPRLYLGVIGWLAFLIILFYLFTRRFAS